MLATFQVFKCHMWLVATHWLALLQNVSIIKEVLLDSAAIDSSHFLRSNISGNISRHYLIIPASSYQFCR